MEEIIFIQNVNSCIRYIIFILFLVLNVVAFPLVTIEGVHRAKDGPKFAYRVVGCDASYTAKYNLVRHLRACHNVTMEPNKLGCPSIQEEGPRHQDHTTMNVRILNNPLA